MCPFAADKEVCHRDMSQLHLLRTREVTSMSQDMDMEKASQEGQEAIQIHLQMKYSAASLNGHAVYLLVPLLRLLQAPKESYIGRANTTGFAPYLPQHSIPVLELKAMRLATAEDKAMYTIQDALALELYPEQSLIVIRVPAIYVPRMKSAATASRLDALAILLLFALQPTVLHFAETMISNSQSQDTSLQTEQSSLKQLHTDQNISLHVQMTSALQTIRPEERKNCTLEPNAEEEAYMEEVEACRISEVRSHLIHHADFEEWLVRNIV
ncbi:hypothetical protein KCU83_g2921, partial [Aureobasidium melanogenum]